MIWPPDSGIAVIVGKENKETQSKYNLQRLTLISLKFSSDFGRIRWPHHNGKKERDAVMLFSYHGKIAILPEKWIWLLVRCGLPFRGKFLLNLSITHFWKGFETLFWNKHVAKFYFQKYMRKLRWPIWVISVIKEEIYEIKSAVKTILFVLNLILAVSYRNNMIFTKS